MQSLVPFYFFVFGTLTVFGGVLGYAKAKSRASLIAGGVSGALLLLAGCLARSEHRTIGLVLGGVVSLALMGRFVPAYGKQRKVFPAGLMAILGFVGIVATTLGFLR